MKKRSSKFGWKEGARMKMSSGGHEGEASVAYQVRSRMEDGEAVVNILLFLSVEAGQL